MVRGSEIYLESPEDSPITGFYTNRWVDAFNSEQAAQKAMNLVKATWARSRYALESPMPKLEIEEMQTVSFWKARFWKTQGFAFFGDEE